MENEKWDYMVKNSKKQPKRPIKYIFGVLACCLCLVIFITSIYAASQQNLGTDVNIQYLDPNAPPEPTLDKLTFTYNGGHYVVSQKDEFVSGDIVIPDSYDYAIDETGGFVSLPVTEIADYAFQDNTNITSVYIPNSIETIGCYAFAFCTGVTEVYISEGVKTIEELAFAETDITEITIPSTVEIIGMIPFGSCTNLTKVNYNAKNVINPEGNCVFCTNFGHAMDIIIGNNVISIPDFFINQSNISSLTIGEHVESIGVAAFNMCTGFTSVKIPASVTSIGEGAFDCCQMLCEVIINSPAIYEQLTDDSACGCLANNRTMMDLPHPLTIKVLQTIDDGTNDFLNDDGVFSKSTEEIDGQMYVVYTDLSWE